jgi:NAD(P)-dependent dehydrogenase (short-subunit alcohol dehydrogenase family)
MQIALDGKRALVTGASGGLGLHFARVLAEAGAGVTLAARRVGRVEAEAEALRARGLSAEAGELDVTSSESIGAFFDGRAAFDIVVNNAGIAGEGAAMDMELDAFRGVVDTNLAGVFGVAQAAARGMREAGGGSIVNIASILGLRVAGHVSAYAASKAAVVQLTKALALEWARHGIRVNALCPAISRRRSTRTSSGRTRAWRWSAASRSAGSGGRKTSTARFSFSPRIIRPT